MKKILGLIALMSLLAAPASASKLEYFLQLGGENHVNDYNAGQTPLYTQGSEADDHVVTNNTVNWSVRVEASGDYNGAPIVGAANIVFDLVLTKDGNPVNVGKGGPGVAGYYSNINDGVNQGGHNEDTPYGVLHPLLAAFAYSYTGISGSATLDPGRIFDEALLNGPHLKRRTYPTAMGYCLPEPPAGRCSTAGPGVLAGMGAGYEQFIGEFWGGGAGQERAGVGMVGDLSGGQGFCFGLGKGVIAEGQIDTTGLPGGTYTLTLMAGNGNNVLRGDLPNFDCGAGTDGNFAVKADDVVGDSITFIVPVTGCTVPPALVSAVSRRTHAGTDYDIPLNLTGNATSEPRINGVQKLVLKYDKAIGGTPAVGLSAGTLGAVTMSGDELTINMSGVPDGTCLAVTVNGVGCADNPGNVAPTHGVLVTSLYCDVNNNRVVNSTDIAIVKSQSGVGISGTNFRNDVNASGTINSTDIAIVKSRSGVIPAVTCAY